MEMGKSMINLGEYRNRNFLILGLGRAGIALANSLLKAGIRVYGYDDSVDTLKSSEVRKLSALGLEIIQDFQGVAEPVVIASPGFPDTHRAVGYWNKERGVPIYDELDFVSQFVSERIIAVTGTNGKSTTVTLIGNILKSAGYRVFIGGNLAPGKPFSTALVMPPRDFYVLEVSSFQLARSVFLKPRVAVLLNITDDHIDRHGSFAEYVAAKARIFSRQGPEDYAVVNYDDPVVYNLASQVNSRISFFSVVRRQDGYYRRGWFYFNGQRVVSVRSLVASMGELFNLPHLPIVENALAAICVARILGVSERSIKKGLMDFRPLAHRLELVRKFKGVYYINNSMCTNPVAGIRSLQAFRRKVILIAGGKNKGFSIDDYISEIVRRAKWVILFGEVSDLMAQKFRERRFSRFQAVTTMEEAVRTAAGLARVGDVVLLSPGFASFDMFHDFQERGKVFKDAVKRIK